MLALANSSPNGRDRHRTRCPLAPLLLQFARFKHEANVAGVLKYQDPSGAKFFPAEL